MAKTSAIQRNKHRAALAEQYKDRRDALKKIIKNRTLPMEERFEATLKLAKLPRNSSKTRYRLRCRISGRPRGNCRKFEVSRIALRDLAAKGYIPGLVKASW